MSENMKTQLAANLHSGLDEPFRFSDECQVGVIELGLKEGPTEIQSVSVTGLNYSNLGLQVGLVDLESKEIILISYDQTLKSKGTMEARVQKVFKIVSSHPLNYIKVQFERNYELGAIGLASIEINNPCSE